MGAWDDMLRDLYAGVCKDGSRPKLISKALIPPLEPEFTPEPLKAAKEPPDANPILKENRARLGDAEKEHVERIRKSVELNELLVELGIREARRIREQPETADEQPADETSATQARETPETQSPEGATGCNPGRQPGESEPTQSQSPVRGDRTNAPDARIHPPRVRGLPLLTLAARAARDLPKLSADLLAAESKWLETDARERVQNAFYLDRAVALVTDLFFHMDEQFAELGFGNWMPFRYPDQWCMFVGLLSRILAAHGLMPAEPGRAEIYRKLLDETPAINEIAETAIRPPKSYGKARANREFPTMQALQDEVFARAAKPP